SVFNFNIRMAGRFNFILTKAFFTGVCGQYGEKNNAGQDKIGRPYAEMLNLNTLLYNEINTVYQTALMPKLQEALTFNGSVIAANDIEQYEKTVNDIAIRQVLFQNGELTAVQVDTLQSIVAECPKYSGHGVYRARGLLTGCYEENWSDNNARCYPTPPFVQELVLDNGFGQRSGKKLSDSQPFAYPNPATDGIFVRTIPAQEGQIVLQDMTGKAWREVPFAQTDVKYLDLSGVPSVVYTCAVIGSTGERQVIKIFVVKP
ncbi:MAG: hypothetical protein ACKVU2_11845, partial [Saprospiraceae bacterium]